MNLTAEQIQDNWNKFLSIIDEHISEPRCSELKSFYELYAERIMLMPASHKKEYHNAFPGGYVDHVLRVVQCALKLHQVWKEMGVDTSAYTFDELVFAALNHDLGKMGDEENESYLPQDDQWRKDKLGEDYKFNNQLEYMSVPDRSLYLLMSHDIVFSKNEMLAIKLHDGLYDLKSLFEDKRLLLKSYTKYSILSLTGLKEEVIVVFGITDTSSELIV